MTPYERLIEKARIIKTETEVNANTALRVGGWMEEAIQFLEGVVSVKQDAWSDELTTQSREIVAAINEVAMLAGQDTTRVSELAARVEELAEQFDGKAEMREYPTFSQFPESGLPNTLYIDTSTGATYRWDGEQYAVMGGYTAGYGIEITSSGEIKAEPLTDAEIEAICV